MVDFDGIAKNIPFTVECFMATETGQAQRRKNSKLGIGWYWHEKEGESFSFDGSNYESLPDLLEHNPILAGASLAEYGMRDNAS